jgi:predicted nucleic acid-binding protein
MRNGSGSLTGEMTDTNILVYSHDPTNPEKQSRALRLVEDLIARDALAISVQVLNEFYVSATRPHKPPALPHDQACAIVRDLVVVARVLPLTTEVTLRALDAMPLHGLSFWDALIWAAAAENGVRTVYTEDFQHGREVEGVRFVSPFVP